MKVYIDTSAILAFMNAAEVRHELAKAQWVRLLQSSDTIVCNSYVLLETYALVLSRMGIAAARTLHEDVFPVLHVDWVDEVTHREAVSAMLIAGRKDLSLVDCSSFVTMRRLGIRKAFALDEHFREQGFDLVPAPTPVRSPG